MPTPKEALFRDALRAMTQDADLHMPASLCRDILDHLHRKDANGYTLCFDSPQRAQLLDLIDAWADVYCPEVRERLMYLGIHPVPCPQTTFPE